MWSNSDVNKIHKECIRNEVERAKQANGYFIFIKKQSKKMFIQKYYIHVQK